MPDIDITEAKRELLAGREPIGLIFNGKRYEFPSVMPAAFELEQMAIDRETRGMSADAQAPADSQERLMRAAFGEKTYDELRETVGVFDLMLALYKLIGYWVEPYQDPNLPSRLLASGRAGPTSSAPSSSTGQPSKPTSGANTESISRLLSGASNGSHGDASSRSTRGSRRRP